MSRVCISRITAIWRAVLLNIFNTFMDSKPDVCKVLDQTSELALTESIKTNRRHAPAPCRPQEALGIPSGKHPLGLTKSILHIPIYHSCMLHVYQMWKERMLMMHPVSCDVAFRNATCRCCVMHRINRNKSLANASFDKPNVAAQCYTHVITLSCTIHLQKIAQKHSHRRLHSCGWQTWETSPLHQLVDHFLRPDRSIFSQQNQENEAKTL